MTYILVQEHVTSTKRGEQQKFATLDTSGCLMVDVPRLDHLRDGQKEHHNNEKVIWCIESRIACIACLYNPHESYHARIAYWSTCMFVVAPTDHSTRGGISHVRMGRI